ncbi:deoxyribodipyrimidine photo-lyase [Thiomicrorhabdus aquaedulcis]|uniref:deoxyribodipyrimidine photo-lyase n=1 Tax=Thiomicrorhabdus aquaedulcis TaxID=2211106 RepID=UPI000FDAAE00|nr:deoxyribodipyrimidine photo-lyase [Thiomicrorhabdus aquaedulcis]
MAVVLSHAPTLVWVQREFRLNHLPALQAALARPGKVIVAYFHDSQHLIGEPLTDNANQAWLAQSLLALKADLMAHNADLWMIEGDFTQQLSALIGLHNIKHLHYSFAVGLPFNTMQQQALAVCQACKVALTPFFSEFWINPSEFFNKQQNLIWCLLRFTKP